MSVNQTFLSFHSSNDFQFLDLIEDPIYCTYVEKTCFVEMYHDLLITLDGSDETAFIDFYFEKSPLNNSILVFRDEDAKLDFREFAIELNLIPGMKEIYEGESKHEKQLRLLNKPQTKQTKKVNTKDPRLAKSLQASKTLDSLMKKLSMESDPFMRTKLESKISKTLIYVDHSY